MLALAIGATTAMLTILDALMLHPVPFRHADRLTAVVVGVNNGRGFLQSVPPPVLRSWQTSGAFSSVEGAMQSPVILDTGVEVIAKPGARITPGLLGMLEIRPILGRAFTEGEGRAGTDDRILISEELWQTLFNRDPGIIGRHIRVSGRSTEVVGILPAGFRFPSARTVAWLPIDFDAPPPDITPLRPIAYALLRPGVPAADARRAADEAAHGSGALPADRQTLFRPVAAGMGDTYSRRAVTVLSLAVGLVFVVLCANAMNLMLTRFSARQREFGLCSALGASRARLLREALAETTIVAFIAAALGLLVTHGLVTLATRYLPDAFLSSTLTPVAISWRAIGATSVLGLVAAAITGIAPAWLATRVDAAQSLRLTGPGGSAVRSRRRLSRALLVGEMALATTLLVGAMLLIRTFVNLTQADRGLNVDGVVTSWVSLPEFAFPDRPGRIAFAGTLEERLRKLPGVEQVSLSGGLPPSSGSIYFGKVRTDSPDPREVVLSELNVYNVSSRFFELFGIPLVAGRSFSEPSALGEVILGERFARMLWPDGQAVGRTFRFDGSASPQRVVGVVGEIRNPSLDPRLDRPEMYFPLVVERDGRSEASAFGSGQIFVAVRCTVCPGLPEMRAAIRGVSAQVVIASLGPLEEEYIKDLARPRAAAILAAAFATLALLASAGGLFGVLTAAVAQRRREFGIRVALGIDPGRLRRLVVLDAARLAVAGFAFGGIGAWTLSRSLASLTFGVSSSDPRSWGIVGVALGCCVVAAAWRPASQAARVDPVSLLRQE